MKGTNNLNLPTEISESAFCFIETVLTFDQDFVKWQKGNKSAGVRARKALMSIKKFTATVKTLMKATTLAHNED